MSKSQERRKQLIQLIAKGGNEKDVLDLKRVYDLEDKIEQSKLELQKEIDSKVSSIELQKGDTGEKGEKGENADNELIISELSKKLPKLNEIVNDFFPKIEKKVLSKLTKISEIESIFNPLKEISEENRSEIENIKKFLKKEIDLKKITSQILKELPKPKELTKEEFKERINDIALEEIINLKDIKEFNNIQNDLEQLKQKVIYLGGGGRIRIFKDGTDLGTVTELNLSDVNIVQGVSGNRANITAGGGGIPDLQENYVFIGNDSNVATATQFVPVVSGGTGVGSHTAGALLFGNGTSPIGSSKILYSAPGTTSARLTTVAGNALEFLSDTRFYFDVIGSDNFIYIDTTDTEFSNNAGLYKFNEGSTYDAYGILNFSNLATADKTFTFPNTSGTVALTSDIPAGGTPAGSNTEIQFNNSGAFGASSQLKWDTNKILLKNNADNESLVGNQMVNSTGWTSTGWTGDFDTGFTHTAGNTNALTNSFVPDITKRYLVTFTIVANTGFDSGQNIVATMGGFGLFLNKATSQFQGIGGTFRNIIEPINTNPITFAPSSGYLGTVQDISVLEITDDINPIYRVLDSSDNIDFEMRFFNNNIFIGKDAGKQTTGVQRNIVVGNNSFSENFNGQNTIVIGHDVMNSISNSSSSTVIGSNALNSITLGNFLTAYGANVLMNATSANFTTAMGLDAGRGWTSTANSSFFGYKAGGTSAASGTSSNITYIGNQAGFRLYGQQNTAVGSLSLFGASNGNGTGTRNVAVGYRTGQAISSGSNNIFIGTDTGRTVTTASNRIMIGDDINWGDNTTSGVMSIGNLLFGTGMASGTTISTGSVGIGIRAMTARLHLPASTASANSASLKIDVGTLLTTPEIGAVEFNGTNLYFTDSGGTRRQLAVV